MLQHVAACCSMLQCAAVCCSVLQCVAVCQTSQKIFKHMPRAEIATLRFARSTWIRIQTRRDIQKRPIYIQRDTKETYLYQNRHTKKTHTCWKITHTRDLLDIETYVLWIDRLEVNVCHVLTVLRSRRRPLSAALRYTYKETCKRDLIIYKETCKRDLFIYKETHKRDLYM